MRLSRRILLASSAAGAAAAVPATGWAQSNTHPTLATDPFTLGVASGDPEPGGVVLWTRLAVDPLAEDGMGGMPNAAFDVKWEVARDERFRHRVAHGEVQTAAEIGHSVHIEVEGLRAGHEYYYRFKTGKWISPIGRTVTAPPRNSMPDELRMAFASCSQYEHGYFTAYRHMAESRPDLILHLGDYQYEYKAKVYNSPDGNVRDHEGPETVSLATYRQRHAQYKADPDLQLAHAAAPWLVVWDDHETENNWADEFPEAGSDTPAPADFLARRAAAFQAYWENMPLRRSSVPEGIDMQLYRRVRWGRLANFHMMDTRQYRDDQACGDGTQSNCADAWDESRTITGEAQEEWLIDGFHASRARWDILGQQVFFTQRDNTAAADVLRTSMDGWDGYAASRQRLIDGWVEAGVRNPVVLTGDVHTHWAGEIKTGFPDIDGESVGVELVATSITSGGNGVDSVPEDNAALKINPHIKFRNAQRGYVETVITPDQMDVDFKVVPQVTVPDAPVYTRRSYTIADRERALHQTYDRPVDVATMSTNTSPFAGSDENADDYLN
ncbi:alkaline phosphatase D family protein [Glycomyces algeriensis]|uniref:Alkaline phosphatase D n=1 Tax=Glycomyces algeriensis TaxID=256037 RepID=A0A9W6LJ31_9ACTN|nr:alkaline phosphatase D family protein [Glycomyces algeriensis]MDA1369051.1 alkaline phosphatase D family protein [Glycomyces algeriensis]MDR7352453.1 alkaline phosphatase D [Glycomyces algeriensis]GLI45193.1 alkaline phosphatase D [Glycomyces algeriensis]